jgi:serine/threonine-protein kinase 24/25/MST4
MYVPSIRNNGTWDGSLRSEWSFDTIKSMSAMGSYRSMARDFAAHGSIPDDYEYEDDEVAYEARDSVQTDGATKGSDVTATNRLFDNAEASHSTVLIRHSGERDLPSLLHDTSSEESVVVEPSTPPQKQSISSQDQDSVEPPPAYSGSVSGSVRSARRASYAARNNVTSGTVLMEADIGTGVDTIRPVKKVDTVRSLRMGEEYVGSMKRDRSSSDSQNGSAPSSPVGSKLGSAKKLSEAAKAGKSMVDDVLLPTLERVRCLYMRPPFCSWVPWLILYLSAVHS